MPTNIGSCQYSPALIFRRSDIPLKVIVFSTASNLIAINTYWGSKWTGWNSFVTNSDLYTKIVDANFVNGEVSITINDIDVTKYSWSAVGRTGMTIITSILPENTNTLKLTARGWWDSTVLEGATRNIQLIGVKISS